MAHLCANNVTADSCKASSSSTAKGMSSSSSAGGITIVLCLSTSDSENDVFPAACLNGEECSKSRDDGTSPSDTAAKSGSESAVGMAANGGVMPLLVFDCCCCCPLGGISVPALCDPINKGGVALCDPTQKAGGVEPRGGILGLLLSFACGVVAAVVDGEAIGGPVL